MVKLVMEILFPTLGEIISYWRNFLSSPKISPNFFFDIYGRISKSVLKIFLYIEFIIGDNFNISEKMYYIKDSQNWRN